MAATKEEVEQLILRKFKSANTHLRQEPPLYIITGKIIWKGFNRLPLEARNRVIKERIRHSLGLRGLNVGVLFPLAYPDEY